jgi:hypothetical protein
VRYVGEGSAAATDAVRLHVDGFRNTHAARGLNWALQGAVSKTTRPTRGEWEDRRLRDLGPEGKGESEKRCRSEVAGVIPAASLLVELGTLKEKVVNKVASPQEIRQGARAVSVPGLPVRMQHADGVQYAAKEPSNFQLNTTGGVRQASSASVTATKSLHVEILRVYVL